MDLKIESPIVSVEWLHKNILAKNLIVLDGTIPKVGKKKEELKETKQILSLIHI